MAITPEFAEKVRCCSSVVEHVIGNDGVGSSILLSSTIGLYTLKSLGFASVYFKVDMRKRPCSERGPARGRSYFI